MISAGDLREVLARLGEKPSKSEVDLMIWVGEIFVAYHFIYRKLMMTLISMYLKRNLKKCTRDAFWMRQGWSQESCLTL